MSVLVVFAMCLAGATLPVFGSEVLVFGAAMRAEGPTCALLIVVAAGAQSIGKLLVYASAARGARTPTADRLGIHVLHAYLDRSRSCVAAIVFASALASVPPLYPTAIVCGAARYGPLPFGLAVFAARIVRYALLITILQPPSWWGA